MHPRYRFERSPSEFVNLLQETGEPIVMTINGKAEIIVQDVKPHQTILGLSELLGMATYMKKEYRGSMR